MNRHWRSVAALLLSATFGMGCLAEAESDFDSLSDDVGSAQAALVVQALETNSDSVAAATLDRSMTIAEFVAHTNAALASKHDLSQSNSSKTRNGLVGFSRDPEGGLFGPDPQPWKAPEEEEEETLGPDPQPW